jgi:protein-L-isoaspartate(D-aspartate) O-methyltransferase
MMEPSFFTQKAELIMTLRGQGIRDTAVLSAIETTPREAFIPAPLQQHAYDNVSLPIAHGQTISQPYIVARMTEALALTGRERVLEIGTGSGYQASVLSQLCRRVYSIERLRPLLVEAERLMTQLKITNFTTKLGDGAQGWPEAAPFDRIILTCAAPTRPDLLLEQLKLGGIMVAPIADHDDHQILIVYSKSQDNVVTEKKLLAVKFVPLISDLND